jgi:hypothetical protein
MNVWVEIELRNVERDECSMEWEWVVLGEELGSVCPFELPQTSPLIQMFPAVTIWVVGKRG